MTDGTALLAALCENPDDDTRRLIYADWLEENGQDKRANYIRAEVERHSCDHADSDAAAVGTFLSVYNESDCKWVDWSVVDKELDRYHKAVIQTARKAGKPTPKSENLPRTKGVVFGEIKRGFHSLVKLSDPERFLADASAIFRAAPITDIQFNRLSADQARKFVSSGHLARIRHLAFMARVEPEAIAVVANHTDAAGVRSLFLETCGIGADQVEALATGTGWASVTRLELGGFDYEIDTSSAIFSLLRQPRFCQLRRFRCALTDYGNPLCRAIASAGLTELRRLDLNYNEIEESGAVALASSKKLPNLQYLDLDGNDIGGDAVAELINTAKLPKLAALRLSETSGLSPKVLAKPGRAPTLRALSLSNIKVGSRGFAALVACPALAGLWYLALHWCEMSDGGLAALARHAGFQHLVALHLCETAVGEAGVVALAKCPALNKLQDLCLNTRAISGTAARALVKSPYLQGLKHLSAEGRGVARLRKHFGNKVVP